MFLFLLFRSPHWQPLPLRSLWGRSAGTGRRTRWGWSWGWAVCWRGTPTTRGPSTMLVHWYRNPCTGLAGKHLNTNVLQRLTFKPKVQPSWISSTIQWTRLQSEVSIQQGIADHPLHRHVHLRRLQESAWGARKLEILKWITDFDTSQIWLQLAALQMWMKIHVFGYQLDSSINYVFFC